MFAKVMREYGLSFDQVLKLTPRRFWFVLNQINRLRAEEKLIELHLLGAVNSEEAFVTAQKSLTDQLGQVYVWMPKNIPAEIKVDEITGEELDPEFDRNALRAMKARLASGG